MLNQQSLLSTVLALLHTPCNSDFGTASTMHLCLYSAAYQPEGAVIVFGTYAEKRHCWHVEAVQQMRDSAVLLDGPSASLLLLGPSQMQATGSNARLLAPLSLAVLLPPGERIVWL